jgi:hypothetical protein
MAVSDGADFVRRFHRLPSEVFVGSMTLSLADFAATLAGGLDGSNEVKVVRGNIEFERYFGSDGRKAFNWIIHTEGFDGAPLSALGASPGLDAEAGHNQPVSSGSLFHQFRQAFLRHHTVRPALQYLLQDLTRLVQLACRRVRP